MKHKGRGTRRTMMSRLQLLPLSSYYTFPILIRNHPILNRLVQSVIQSGENTLFFICTEGRDSSLRSG